MLFYIVLVVAVSDFMVFSYLYDHGHDKCGSYERIMIRMIITSMIILKTVNISVRMTALLQIS